MDKSRKNWIVTLSSYSPRACGIATYAENLIGAVQEAYEPDCELKVIAVNRDSLSRFRYPKEVIAQVDQQRVETYAAAAEEMNRQDRVKVVHVQHEFGLFGGEFGANLLHFTERCRKPMVVTFHTVLPEPPEAMREVVRRLAASVGRIIVMTERAGRLLQDAYGVAAEKIVVIPHGIPAMPYQSSARAKAALGLKGRTVILTFGLLSRGKGIEHVIEALPEVVRRHPRAVYLVVGATHPDIVQREGESYRAELLELVRRLGLEEHVHFYNEFVDNDELWQFLRASDIYVTTSLDPNQAVSGTLSYALGCGRPVVTTDFAQARESVPPEVGRRVGFRDPAAYAAALDELLGDEALRARLGDEAYVRSRAATWPNVALATFRTYAGVAPSLAGAALALPPIKLSHLERMTDDFGLFQFSHLAEPDPASGYTIDDNARALAALVDYYEESRRPAALDLLAVHLRFLELAARPGVGEFCNFFDQRHRPDTGVDGGNKEDARGRAFQAFARTAAAEHLPEEYRRAAAQMVEEYLHAEPHFVSPRAAAFLVDGLHALWVRDRDPRLAALVRSHCDHLAGQYRANRADGWEWFEDCLTYGNSALPEAMLRGWQVTGEQTFLDVGRTTLDFLIGQKFRDGRYISIGQKEWCRRDGTRSYFDQQPEDPAAMVRTLTAFLELGPDDRLAELRRQAFRWFLGENMLGQVVYDRATGGCYDGVGEHAVNLNQGAESTVSYLAARLAMEP